MINAINIIITDKEDGSVDISFQTEATETTPAVLLSKDLYKLINTYVNTLNEDEPTDQELQETEQQDEASSNS